MSPMSETPQPNSIKNGYDILSTSLDSNKPSSSSSPLQSQPQSQPQSQSTQKIEQEIEKRHSAKLRNARTSTLNPRDDEAPTSPIPQYKHMQILTNHDKVEENIIVNNNNNNNNNDDQDIDDGNNTNNNNNNNGIKHRRDTIAQLAILANQLDFTKLVDKITCFEHFLLIIGVLCTWIFIVSYITLECSQKLRAREIQLFLFASVSSILYFLILNPFYFNKFNNKYAPSTSQQLFEKTQPIPTSNNNININLRINDENDDNHNQLKYHKGSNISDDDESDRSNSGLPSNVQSSSSSSSSSSTTNSKYIIYNTLKWLLRIIGLSGSCILSYYIYKDLDNYKYTNYTRYYIVLLTLCLFIGNLPLMGHFMLYFRKSFLIYYLIGWIIVFGGEFAYFHFKRHLKEELIASFVLINCIFFIFHLITTTWSSYVLKHRTLFEIDSYLFPNSNHYRIYFNFSFDNNHDTTQRNGENEKEKENKNKLNIEPFRTVTCCCNKLICDSHALLRFQSYLSALSFWSFLGIMYTLGTQYIVFSACLFMLVNTVWNPLFYSKEVLFIRRNLKCCCSFRKWFLYIMLIISYIIGFIANIGWCSLSISSFILKNNELNYSIIINLLIFVFTIIIFFLPSVGYSFYRIPVSYSISNIFSALFCFFIPILISFNHNLDIYGSSKLPKHLNLNKIIYYDYDKNKYLGIIISAIIFSLYLAFTGLSCVTYRLKKALYFYNSKRSSQAFTYIINKEFPMSMIMFFSFLLSFALLTINSLWIFGDNFGDDNNNNNNYDTISIIAKLIYIITIFVQCSSLMYAIFTLKSKFDENPLLNAYLTSLTDKVRHKCGFCPFLLLFPFIYALYLIFIILISLCLGITKLLSIRQVREFWLSFLISNEISSPNDNNRNKFRSPNNIEIQQRNSMIQSVPTNSEFNKSMTASRNKDVEIEIMTMNKRDNINMNPVSPNTDFLDNHNSLFPYNNHQNGTEIHRRISSSAIQSVHMKIYKFCDCFTPKWMSSLYINESIYNNYLMSELIVESLPLLMLNLINMFFFDNRITTVSIIQCSISALFLLYSCAKTFFYIRFHEWNLAKFL